MEPSERLRLARERAGFETAAEAARRFGWQIVTYRHHENGTRGFRRPDALKYARAFRVSPEWLLFGTGGPEKKSVPLVGYVGAGAEIFTLDEGVGALDEVDPPPGIGPEAVAVRVRGDSMWPRYMDGDVLIYDRHAPLDRVDGRECVVALPDGRRFVKIVRRNPDGTFTLESWNAPPIHNVTLDWAAEIAWVKRG
ncbi:helix-turn-helix protein [Oceanicella actignis]|nr:helix-turn-helix protein [Oceanicella actignis]